MLREACDHLAVSDPRLGELLARNGVPPLRLRPPGVATLVHLILQQQVSRASAQAVFDRMSELLAGEFTPDGIIAIAPHELRAAGLSHQKIDYVIRLGHDMLAGRFDLAALEDMSDEEALAQLGRLKGVGPWTAAVYVLTALGRPDVWAPGDRALLVSLGRMLGTGDAVPNDVAIDVAAAWSPWRAVAARILWHDYSANEAR